MKLGFSASLAFCITLCAAPVAGQEADTLRAVILGSGSPQFNPERNGPSVLIEYGDVRILVDAGNGTQAGLSELSIPMRSLDGIFFTHHHLDHNEEFIPVFVQALLGGNRFMLAGPPPMQAMTESTLALYDEDITYRLGRRGRTSGAVEGNFAVEELSGGEKFSVGGVEVTTASVNHTIATTAYRFDAGGRSIVISGDLIYSPSLSALAQGADILIIDSGGTIRQDQAQAGGQRRQRRQANEQAARPVQSEGSDRGQAGGGRARAHVNLAETARMASEAGVDTIVLTHFTTGMIDEAATIAELRKGYAGDIIFAEDKMSLPGE